MADPAHKGRFVWADLMSPDSQASIAFYTKVMGWGTQAWEGPFPYTMWTAGGVPVGGVGPLEGAPAPYWLGYVSVADVDAAVAKANGLGATTIVAPADIPTVGRYAVLADPQGAAIAVYKSASPAPPPEGQPGIGEFSWHELATTDPAAAFQFYETMFGWEKTSAMDMGELGVYQMFGLGGVPFGGVYSAPPGMAGGPNWLHYVKVPDVNDAVEMTKAGGGQVVNGPMEVPGGDWIAMAVDPQGAMFAVHAAK